MAFCAAADRVQRGAIAPDRAIPLRERDVHVVHGRTNTRTFIAVAAGQSLDKAAKCGDEVGFGLASLEPLPRRPRERVAVENPVRGRSSFS